jgi:cytochrome c-type biogenesis protein
VAWYGWYEVRVLRGGAVTAPVVDAAAVAQRRLSDLIDGAGAGVLAGVLAVLLIAAAARRLTRGRAAGVPGDRIRPPTGR